MENVDDSTDDLDRAVEALDASHPGSGQRVDQLSYVFETTTRLWKERERLGLSVDHVIDRSGLSLDDVQAIEDNSLDVPHDHLARYAAAVGLQFSLHPLTAA